MATAYTKSPYCYNKADGASTHARRAYDALLALAVDEGLELTLAERRRVHGLLRRFEPLYERVRLRELDSYRMREEARRNGGARC